MTAKRRPPSNRSEQGCTEQEFTEQEFLARYDAAQFPHPSVSVDVALVTADGGNLQALLLQREHHPHRQKWSLPGGFVQMDESLDAAAARVLAAKVGMQGVFLEQLYTFGEVDRDPRTRVITVAYYALVDSAKMSKLGLANHRIRLAPLRVAWTGEQGGAVEAIDDHNKTLPLAFDHAEILGLVVKRLRGKLDYAPIGFELLPKEFSLRRLQDIHETILDRKLNKDSFRRRMLASDLVAPTGKHEADVEHRPAELYRFRRK
jgi:8-oxo-dGTP diphosphatase